MNDSYIETDQCCKLPVAQSVGMVNMVKELRQVFLTRSGSREGHCTTFGEGLYVQAVIEAIRRSDETRQWKKVEMLDEDGSGTIHL